jgi:hypothetical protein
MGNVTLYPRARSCRARRIALISGAARPWTNELAAAAAAFFEPRVHLGGCWPCRRRPIGHGPVVLVHKIAQAPSLEMQRFKVGGVQRQDRTFCADVLPKVAGLSRHKSLATRGSRSLILQVRLRGLGVERGVLSASAAPLRLPLARAISMRPRSAASSRPEMPGHRAA